MWSGIKKSIKTAVNIPRPKHKIASQAKLWPIWVLIISPACGYKSTNDTKSITPADNPSPNDKNLSEFPLIKKVTNPPITVERPAIAENINAIK